MIRWLQITSGRGPRECCWVVFRLTQYLICEATRKGLQTELIEAIPAEESKTFKSALISVEGDSGVADFVNRWQGTVKWIGPSPFRPNRKRKNWFVGVTTLAPLTPENIDRRAFKFESMRASGPGGQHVNKTESAVRVTHIPTGLCAVSQAERSQHLNKKIALARLSQLLRERELESQSKQEQHLWQRHNRLERGNAAHRFRGDKFKYVQ